MALTQFPRRRGVSGGGSGRATAAGLVLVLLAACPSCGQGARTVNLKEDEQTCPPHDVLGHVKFLPHPRDCSMFLRCHEGREVPGRCPPGTAFVRADGTCGDPANSACAPCSTTGRCGYQCSCTSRRGKATCPASTAFSALLYVSEPGCQRDERTFTLLGNKLGRVEVLSGDSTFIIKNCPDNLPPGRSFVPHFANCSRVFLCEDGHEVATDCEAGFLYNTDTGLCEEPDVVTCSTSAGSDETSSEGCPSEAALLSCRYTCDCPISGGQGSCPPRLQLGFVVNIFDSVRNPACLQEPRAQKLEDQYVATGDIEANTTRGRYCPKAGTNRPTYIAHPTDCESFVVCYRGGESVRRCPAGRQYNPATQRCGEADASLCLSGGGSSPASHGLRCPTSWACSSSYRGVPHISDCTLFCRCDGSRPVLAACPPGTHFSARSQTCEDPAVARCTPTCAQLGKLNGSGGEDKGLWQPKSCIDGDSKLGAKCHLKCFPDYVLDGSVRVRCTRQGWASNGVLNTIPACRTPEEIGSKLVSMINSSLAELGNQWTEMLFIIDEASSITARQFAAQKSLVSTIIRIFPLSHSRLAGVATLSSDSRVYIRMIQSSTCDFLSELQTIGRSPVSGSKRPPDITQALEAVEADIDRRSTATRALIFLISSKRSRTKPLPAADVLKGRHALFTIGVGKFNRKQLNLSASRHKDGSRLFFGLPNVKATKRMVALMSREYSSEESNYCF